MTITREQAIDALEAVCAASPDAVNPETCSYTDPHDPDYHCVIGAVCIRLDLPLPAVDDELNEASYDVVAAALGHDINHDAVNVLRRCQTVFDGVSGQNRDLLGQRPWAEVLETCRKRGLL